VAKQVDRAYPLPPHARPARRLARTAVRHLTTTTYPTMTYPTTTTNQKTQSTRRGGAAVGRCDRPARCCCSHGQTEVRELHISRTDGRYEVLMLPRLTYGRRVVAGGVWEPCRDHANRASRRARACRHSRRRRPHLRGQLDRQLREWPVPAGLLHRCQPWQPRVPS